MQVRIRDSFSQVFSGFEDIVLKMNFFVIAMNLVFQVSFDPFLANISLRFNYGTCLREHLRDSVKHWKKGMLTENG